MKLIWKSSENEFEGNYGSPLNWDRKCEFDFIAEILLLILNFILFCSLLWGEKNASKI